MVRKHCGGGVELIEFFGFFYYTFSYWEIIYVYLHELKMDKLAGLVFYVVWLCYLVKI